MKTIQRLILLACALASMLASLAKATEHGSVPATHTVIARSAMMLAATRAESRIVAVGDHGIVLLSDDLGAHFRQAAAVPVSSPLTGVSFVNAKKGWAVGQGGAILATVDGGENWQIQRLATEEDRPLFATYFFNEQEGVAVGLWSLVLTTSDGGKTWNEQQVLPPEGAQRADLNLLSLFTDLQGRLYATAERGKLLRSDDRGITWEYLDTGYNGTFWVGTALSNGTLLVGGQRGSLMRSTDHGQSWRYVALPTKSSITAMAVNGKYVDVVGLDGFLASSRDGGDSFVATTLNDGVSLTAVVNMEGKPLLFSKRGVVPADKGEQTAQGQ